MKIEQVNGEDRFYCHSDSGEVYLVDISNDRDDYGCTCNQFIMRIAPKIEQGYELYTKDTSCKHQRAVLDYINEI